MGATDKIHEYLAAADAALMPWEARGEGFVPAELRQQGKAAHTALAALIVEAVHADERLLAELAAAGHEPLVARDGEADDLAERLRAASGCDQAPNRSRGSGATSH
jgi:glycosyltransferase involved in cell wall biosynthesis